MERADASERQAPPVNQRLTRSFTVVYHRRARGECLAARAIPVPSSRLEQMTGAGPERPVSARASLRSNLDP